MCCQMELSPLALVVQCNLWKMGGGGSPHEMVYFCNHFACGVIHIESSG